MKYRFCCMLICCVLLFSMTLTAYAAGTTEYTLDELGMTVSMPSDYIVFTRDMDENDPNLDAYGLTKDGMSSLMNERKIYLKGWDEDINQEITITMSDIPLKDFNLYSDTTLSTFATSFASQYESAGVTEIKSEIYQHSQAKFLKIYISQPNGDSIAYGLQYFTVYADKGINITMQSYSGQITSSEEVLLKSIVDSTIFDTALQTAEADYTPTSSFTYTDTKTQATFTVPANWVETPLSEESESIDVKFTSLEEDGMIMIMYSSFDVWSEMTASERSGYSRSDVDNSMLTKSNITDIFGPSSNDIKLVTYGGNEYYTETVATSADAYGLSFTVTMTNMMLINNGYMYLFQFNGASDNEFYKDFESLLSSVKFAPSDSKSALENSSDLTSQFSLGNILFSLLVTIIVYSLPIIIYRYAVRKAPVDRKKAKKITIIYGIFTFVVMSALIFAINGSGAAGGGAILLWSQVNYRVLIGGKGKTQTSENIEPIPSKVSLPKSYLEDTCAEDENVQQQTDSWPITEPNEIICQNCGARLPVESKFCHKCGAKVQE